jgi:hypothetical protein
VSRRNCINIVEVSDEVDRKVNFVCAEECQTINQSREDGRIRLDRSRRDNVIIWDRRAGRRKGPKESEWDKACNRVDCERQYKSYGPNFVEGAK